VKVLPRNRTNTCSVFIIIGILRHRAPVSPSTADLHQRPHETKHIDHCHDRTQCG
jgi:hypothetical protein